MGDCTNLNRKVLLKETNELRIKNRAPFCLVESWTNLSIWGPKNTLLKPNCILHLSVALNACGYIRQTILGLKEASYISAKYTIPFPRREILKNITLFPTLLTLLFRPINYNHKRLQQ